MDSGGVKRDFFGQPLVTWSPAEKAIARKAFQSALEHELQALIEQVKQMAEKIKDPSELWTLERFLTRSRNQIDRNYDYRYSVLPTVFARLLRERRLTEHDFEGLREDKLALIRHWARFL
jgi:hypothetical protein